MDLVFAPRSLPPVRSLLFLHLFQVDLTGRARMRLRIPLGPKSWMSTRRIQGWILGGLFAAFIVSRPLISWSLESCEQGYKCGRGIKVAIFILQTWAEVSVTGVAYSRSLLDRIEQNSRYGLAQGIVQVLCICCPPEFLLHGKKKGPFYDSHAICFSLKPLVLFQVNEVYLNIGYGVSQKHVRFLGHPGEHDDNNT